MSATLREWNEVEVQIVNSSKGGDGMAPSLRVLSPPSSLPPPMSEDEGGRGEARHQRGGDQGRGMGRLA